MGYKLSTSGGWVVKKDQKSVYVVSEIPQRITYFKSAAILFFKLSANKCCLGFPNELLHICYHS